MQRCCGSLPNAIGVYQRLPKRRQQYNSPLERRAPFGCLVARGEDLRQILRGQHDVARPELTVSVTEPHQLVSDRSHSPPIRYEQMPSVMPCAFHSGFVVSYGRHRWLHGVENINCSGKISVIWEPELRERKATRRREQRLCGIAGHNDDELRPEPSVIGHLGKFRCPQPPATMPKTVDCFNPQLHRFKRNTQMNGGDCVSAFVNGCAL